MVDDSASTFEKVEYAEYPVNVPPLSPASVSVDSSRELVMLEP